jgi:hypothetical protein
MKEAAMTALRRLSLALLSAVVLTFALGAGPPPKRASANPERCCECCKCETCCMSAQKNEAQGPAFQGKGKGWMGKGKGMADHQADMEVFHYLLDHRKEIKRTVKEVPGGVETVTESANKEVVKKIQEHAEAMHKRVKEGKGIHMRDPLFREIFAHTDKIKMTVTKTKTGVSVKETSDDAHVARLIQAHAKVVSNFIRNGYAEVRKNHEVPTRPKGK